MRKLSGLRYVIFCVGVGASTGVLAQSWVKGTNTRGLSVSSAFNSATSVGYAQFLDETHSLRADVGLQFSRLESQDPQFSFSLGVGYRSYVVTAGSVKAFTQPMLSVKKISSTSDNLMEKMGLSAGFHVGAEYFINPNFSLGAMGGLTLRLNNGFKDIVLGTSTSALFAVFYW